MRPALLSLLLVLPTLAHAGAWARELGGVYLRVGPSIFLGEEAPVFTDVDDSPEVRFEGRALEFYAEVGVGVGLEVDLSARWVDHRNEQSDGSDQRRTGPGDLEAMLKWAPVNGATAFSLVGGLRHAPYRATSLEDQLDGAPPLGPGGEDLLTGAGLGHSFHPLPMWLNVDLLHRLRLGGSSSGLRLRAETGGRPWRRLALIAEIAWQPAHGRTLDQPDDAPDVVPDALMLTGKVALDLWAGLGLGFDASWLPDAGNDGPGLRLAAALTWTR